MTAASETRQMRAEPSRLLEASRLPSAEKATVVTSSSWAPNGTPDPVTGSRTAITPNRLASAIRVPSRVKATLRMMFSLWPVCHSRRPSLNCHMRVAPSSPPVASREPSEDSPTAITHSFTVYTSRRSAPSGTDHTLAWRSWEPEANLELSAENATDLTTSKWASGPFVIQIISGRGWSACAVSSPHRARTTVVARQSFIGKILRSSLARDADCVNGIGHPQPIVAPHRQRIGPIGQRNGHSPGGKICGPGYRRIGGGAVDADGGDFDRRCAPQQNTGDARYEISSAIICNREARGHGGQFIGQYFSPRLNPISQRIAVVCRTTIRDHGQWRERRHAVIRQFVFVSEEHRIKVEAPHRPVGQLLHRAIPGPAEGRMTLQPNRVRIPIVKQGSVTFRLRQRGQATDRFPQAHVQIPTEEP